jgi:DNA-binding FadR family transcriptional regulator
VEGLVFRGVLRPQDDFAALREVIEVREALDIVMAQQIIDALHGGTDKILEGLVATMVAKSATGDSFAEEDLAFHTRLLSYLDNTLVGQLVTAFWEINTVLYPKLGIAPATDIDDTARAHGAMLDAAKAGDLEAYRAAVVAHYQPLRRSLEKAKLQTVVG